MDINDFELADTLSRSIFRRIKYRAEYDVAGSDNYYDFYVHINDSFDPNDSWALTIEDYKNKIKTKKMFLHLVHLYTKGSIVTELPQKMDERAVTNAIHELLIEFRRNKATATGTMNVTVNGYSM